jgi:hypothetical protein
MIDFKRLSSVSRTRDAVHVLVPALKRWAIFTPSAIANVVLFDFWGTTLIELRNGERFSAMQIMA